MNKFFLQGDCITETLEYFGLSEDAIGNGAIYALSGDEFDGEIINMEAHHDYLTAGRKTKIFTDGILTDQAASNALFWNADDDQQVYHLLILFWAAVHHVDGQASRAYRVSCLTRWALKRRLATTRQIDAAEKYAPLTAEYKEIAAKYFNGRR